MTLDDRPFTVEEIRRTIGFMRSRYEDGQGGLDAAMCRLSLPMSEALLDRLEARDAEVAEATRIACELGAEVQDWRDGAAKAAAEPCGDERHCTCVPALRHEVARLTADLATARGLVERLVDALRYWLCGHSVHAVDNTMIADADAFLAGAKTAATPPAPGSRPA